ncbi:MAG: hypothetical protein HY263_01825 [Chloroflexi bacterium]|nr:hypothetical protein [Chloroflexota bacterium]
MAASPTDGVRGRSSLIRLHAADASVALDPDRGGRLASLQVGGRELFVGPSSDEDRSTQWGCFLMAPWPGRLAGGRVRWDGHDVQLARTGGDHAIHGVVHDRPWTVTHRGADVVELACPLDRADWPFGGEVRQRIAIEPGRLSLHAEVIAGEAMPAALGWHPWFSRRGGDPSVRLAAGHVLATRDQLPTGELWPVDSMTDLRTGPALGGRRIDAVYPDPSSPVDIDWPDLHLAMEFGAPLGVIVVYTPPEGFCVEPQTAWPNALGMPPDSAGRAGVRLLGAGESLAANVRINWR